MADVAPNQVWVFKVAATIGFGWMHNVWHMVTSIPTPPLAALAAGRYVMEHLATALEFTRAQPYIVGCDLGYFAQVISGPNIHAFAGTDFYSGWFDPERDYTGAQFWPMSLRWVLHAQNPRGWRNGSKFFVRLPGYFSPTLQAWTVDVNAAQRAEVLDLLGPRSIVYEGNAYPYQFVVWSRVQSSVYYIRNVSFCKTPSYLHKRVYIVPGDDRVYR